VSFVVKAFELRYDNYSLASALDASTHSAIRDARTTKTVVQTM
jgi:hypothetical protein